jgi:hypothetical protein
MRSENIIRSILRFPVLRPHRVLPLPAAFLIAVTVLSQSCAAQKAQIDAQRARLESDKEAAIQEVRRIVNQPVRQWTQTDNMQVSTYRPGWFHAGAAKPDFNNVDIRTTQDASYGQHEYVTSDLNPGIVFMGSEVEFNPNTKYFYTDYSLPKKKLSDAEMIEVNRLYRIIGRCEKQLADLQK